MLTRHRPSHARTIRYELPVASNVHGTVSDDYELPVSKDEGRYEKPRRLVPDPPAAHTTGGDRHYSAPSSLGANGSTPIVDHTR